MVDQGKSFNERRAALARTIERMEAAYSMHEDYMKCLRYELGLETARRELAEAEVARLTEARATERDALRAELRMERAHSARCELWVGAMRTDARHYLAQIKQARDAFGLPYLSLLLRGGLGWTPLRGFVPERGLNIATH